MQRLAAARFHDDRGAELKSGCEIFRSRIGLDDVHHVFLQRPGFERMRGRLCAELRRFAGFAVKDAVVGSKAAFFDDRRRRDNLLAGCAGSADPANIFVALIGGVKEFAISRRRLFADGEGAMNLRRVAPIADRQLGDDDAAFFEHARRFASAKGQSGRDCPCSSWR